MKQFLEIRGDAFNNVFIVDRHQGLINSIKHISSYSKIWFDTSHLIRNIEKEAKSDVESFNANDFYGLFLVKSKEQYMANLQSIKHDYGIKVSDYIESSILGTSPEQSILWFAFNKQMRLYNRSSSSTERINSFPIASETRRLQGTALIESILQVSVSKVTEFIEELEKSIDNDDNDDILTKYATKYWEDQLAREISCYSVSKSNGEKEAIVSRVNGNRYLVNIEEFSCTCLRPFSLQMPCIHYFVAATKLKTSLPSTWFTDSFNRNFYHKKCIYNEIKDLRYHMILLNEVISTNKLVPGQGFNLPVSSRFKRRMGAKIKGSSKKKKTTS